MKYRLICDDTCRHKIKEMLDGYGLINFNRAEQLAIVQRGMQSEALEYPVSIVFDKDRLEDVEAGLTKVFGLRNNESVLSDDHIVGKLDDKFAMVEYKDIHYFNANSNDVFFHTDQSYQCKFKLYELESSLKDMGFIRINKSEIVNIKKVKEIVPWFNSRLILVLANDQELVVTKSYTKIFKDYIGF